MPPEVNTAADTALREIRARSLRTLQTVLAGVALLCCVCGLITYQFAHAIPIPLTARAPISMAFLGMALLDVLALFGCSAWLSR